MANSVYQINKGIMRPIEFKGLKGQYIWYLGAGVVSLLIIYAAMYFMGVNDVVCIVVILSLGGGLVHRLYAMSNLYGEYGLMKKMARRAVPKVVRVDSRKIFMFVGRNVARSGKLPPRVSLPLGKPGLRSRGVMTSGEEFYRR